MIKRRATTALIPVVILFLLIAACSKQEAENPFNYPFIKKLPLKRQAGKPYSEYKAFYVLTEDLEPRVETTADVRQVRAVLQYALELSVQHKVPWTHFVEVNTLAPAFVSEDQQLKQESAGLIADLKTMVGGGDDCELHLHGPVNLDLVEFWNSRDTLRVRPRGAKSLEGYRQRKSFFFSSFYAAGYRDLVSSLKYGKHILEQSIYDGKQEVIAFRPGGWDHGSTRQDTLLYFSALIESGFKANSGLASGDFGSQSWRVGNDPGQNVAMVTIGEDRITEVSPTVGAGGYVNPVLQNDLERLARAAGDEIAVIVSVYHLGGLQPAGDANEQQGEQTTSAEDIQKQREALERHFKLVSDLASRKILYPITLRELLAIIAEQQLQ